MANTIKTLGIVLNSSKHIKDAARLVDIFSPELGRFSAVMRGVEKPKAKLSVASQPFCFGEFVLVEKNGYYTVTDCFVHDSFFDLTYNLDAYVLGCSILELTSKVVLAGQESIELFKFLLNTLKVLVYEKAEPTAAAIKYIIEVLRGSGFGLDLNKCEICGKDLSKEKIAGMIYEGSGVLCASEFKKVNCLELSASEWGVLRNINSVEINNLSGLRFSSRESLTSCLKLMLKQIYFRTGEKLKTLDGYFE